MPSAAFAGRARAVSGSERGATLVEFLAVAVLTVVAVLGVGQMAVWVWARNVAVSAAHEGARTAAEAGRPLADGRTRTQVLLHDGLGAGAAEFAIDVTQSGDLVAVRASGDAPMILPFMPRFTIDARASVLDEDSVFE